MNAIDNKQRDASMSIIDVDMSRGGPDEPSWFSVMNDGRGIPVQMHKTESECPHPPSICTYACVFIDVHVCMVRSLSLSLSLVPRQKCTCRSSSSGRL